MAGTREQLAAGDPRLPESSKGKAAADTSPRSTPGHGVMLKFHLQSVRESQPDPSRASSQRPHATDKRARPCVSKCHWVTQKRKEGDGGWKKSALNISKG